MRLLYPRFFSPPLSSIGKVIHFKNSQDTTTVHLPPFERQSCRSPPPSTPTLRLALILPSWFYPPVLSTHYNASFLHKVRECRLHARCLIARSFRCTAGSPSPFFPSGLPTGVPLSSGHPCRPDRGTIPPTRACDARFLRVFLLWKESWFDPLFQ